MHGGIESSGRASDCARTSLDRPAEALAPPGANAPKLKNASPPVVIAAGGAASFSAASGNAKRVAYDEENRLVSVTVDGVPTADYVYDALGRRILTHDLVTQLRTRHVYGAGFEPLAEYESSDNWETEDLAREFLWGERFPEPLVLIDWTAAGDVAAESEEVLHYLHDHLGSVIALVDAGDPDEKPEPIPPKVVERYTYDPYGTTYIETWNGSGFDEVEASAYGNPFAWTAQRYDAGVGLYAFPFRSYSPALARFLQRDPLGYIDGPNLYEYARSMPTVLTDPMGLAAGVAGGISGGGGGGIGSGPGALGGAEPSAGGPSACGGIGIDLETYVIDPERIKKLLRDVLRDLIEDASGHQIGNWPIWLRALYWGLLQSIESQMDAWLQAWNAFWNAYDAWQQQQASSSASRDDSGPSMSARDLPDDACERAEVLRKEYDDANSAYEDARWELTACEAALLAAEEQLSQSEAKLTTWVNRAASFLSPDIRLALDGGLVKRADFVLRHADQLDAMLEGEIRTLRATVAALKPVYDRAVEARNEAARNFEIAEIQRSNAYDDWMGAARECRGVGWLF
jgi:RHS repeat-associated protein